MNQEILAATEWSAGAVHEYPERIVVVAHKSDDGTIMEYSRHYQQIRDGKPALFHGNYYGRFSQAMQDLRDTLERNNRNFPKGSISHFPGIAFILPGTDALPVGKKYQF
jgi:hypothetical protein